MNKKFEEYKQNLKIANLYNERYDNVAHRILNLEFLIGFASRRLKKARFGIDDLNEINDEIVRWNAEIESRKIEEKYLKDKCCDAEKKVKEFAKKYLTFSAKEVVEEFIKVRKKYNDESLPKVNTEVLCTIPHNGTNKHRSKKFDVSKTIDYLNNEKNIDIKNRSSILFTVQSNEHDLEPFSFIFSAPLDLDMQMFDGSKLSDNIKTERDVWMSESKKQVEYRTSVELKKSAMLNVPVYLDGIGDTYRNKIVKEVFENLCNKSLNRMEEEDKIL